MRLIVLVLWLCVGTSGISDDPQAVSAGTGSLPQLPHLRIDLDRRFLDLDASIICQRSRPGEWLELLACTPQGPTHESILAVSARPSHVHLGLVMLGLEPGSPMRWSVNDQKTTIETPVSGPVVAVTARFEKNGKTVEIPVDRWIIHRKTGKRLPDNVWLFAGSGFRHHDGKTVYLADQSGTVLSLVNFGDELLAKKTDLTNRNDAEAWQTAPEGIPPVGTQVTLRLRPVQNLKRGDQVHHK